MKSQLYLFWVFFKKNPWECVFHSVYFFLGGGGVPGFLEGVVFFLGGNVIVFGPALTPRGARGAPGNTAAQHFFLSWAM
jgi:hypothetical protein